MSWSKVSDIAYGRLRSPDLDVAEEFLTRFGLHRTERTANALYMRGTDPNHHIHITEKGDPKFVGIAYYVNNEDDLKKLEANITAQGLPPEAFGWYLDLRRWGSVPHAGFGLGVERTLAWLCGLHHVRETIPFARTIERLSP